MDWGDGPGWAGVLVAIAAVAFAAKARGDGKKSAMAAAESVVEARRAADAAEAANVDGRRSADTAEAALALQQREADERRAADAEAARPRVTLVIEHYRKSTWRLVNHGSAVAEGVRFVDVPESLIQRQMSDEVRLDPEEAHDFMIAPSMGSPTPTMLRVVWDGQETPVSLRVPPGLG